jgi:hypothetical protein
MLKIPALSIALSFALAASAMAQERQWNFDVSDTDAYLLFGVPESDDVGMSFWCGLRTGDINIIFPEADPTLPADSDLQFTITAGEETITVDGKTSANEEAGSISVETHLAESDPFWRHMLDADRFKVSIGKEELIFPLVDAELAGFMLACRKN